MRVYKFYPKHWALDAVQRERLKIATFDDLNDPFELSAINVSDKYNRAVHKKIRDKLTSEIGFISFSLTWNDPVVWSHYADNHKGIALEFDIPEIQLTKIEYMKLMITPSQYFGKGGITDESVTKRMLERKFAHWKYEREVRRILNLTTRDPVSGLFFKDFDNEMKLTKIILGAHYKPQGASKWQYELENFGIEIVTSRLAFSKFEVVKQNNKRLQKSI